MNHAVDFCVIQQKIRSCWKLISIEVVF